VIGNTLTELTGEKNPVEFTVANPFKGLTMNFHDPLNQYAEVVQPQLETDEGFRGKPYKDTEGLWTVGYGWCLERRDLPKPLAQLILAWQIAETVEEMLHEDRLRELLEEGSKELRAVLINMAFNLGIAGLMGFNNFLTALEEEDYTKASEEMLDSKWARQVKSRATRLSDIIRAMAD